VLLRYRHPVTIVTKGSLILRDLDLLSELASQRLARVMISLTTLDDELKRTWNPCRRAQGAFAGDPGDARGRRAGGGAVFADDSDDQRQ
jgi:MoaA/NifB/PqqE/SkfB family radical SAM enzyme